jgi:hypothetical protein
MKEFTFSLLKVRNLLVLPLDLGKELSHLLVLLHLVLQALAYVVELVLGSLVLHLPHHSPRQVLLFRHSLVLLPRLPKEVLRCRVEHVVVRLEPLPRTLLLVVV